MPLLPGSDDPNQLKQIILQLKICLFHITISDTRHFEVKKKKKSHEKEDSKYLK